MGVALEGQDMGAKPVQKETVVTDDDGAAGEILDGGFKCLQGFHVQIVGRLIEKQHIAARFQQPCHVDAVAFSA